MVTDHDRYMGTRELSWGGVHYQIKQVQHFQFQDYVCYWMESYQNDDRGFIVCFLFTLPKEYEGLMVPTIVNINPAYMDFLNEDLAGFVHGKAKAHTEMYLKGM